MNKLFPKNYSAKRLSGLVKLKGKTYEEIFGIEKAKAMKEKMRLAKLGKKMPWNSKLGMKGELSPRWIKDRTKLAKRQKRNDMAYKEWRFNVWKRDNFKCRMADDNCAGKIIAHHILGWSNFLEKRYDITNGITLCRHHHPRKRADEIRLISTFNKLIELK